MAHRRTARTVAGRRGARTTAPGVARNLRHPLAPATLPEAMGEQAERSTTDHARLGRRAGLVAAGTLLSRVLGAVRDAVIAATFPLVQTDAFVVAFTIPNALRQVLGEGAMSAAVVPLLAEARQRRGEAAARALAGSLLGTLGALLLLVVLAGILLAPVLVALYAAGYLQEPARYAMAVRLTRWLFPYLGLVGLGTVAAGALHTAGRFAVPSAAPALLNVALVAAPWLFAPVALALGGPEVLALALGALLGGTLQCALLLGSARRRGLLGRVRFAPRDPAVREAFRRLGPLAFGLGVYQLNLVASRLLASFLPHGAQSYLYYGQRLVEIPQGMLALAVATASLPTLSALGSRGEGERAYRVLRWGLRTTWFLATPAAALLLALAEPTVAVVFGRGHFGAEAIAETARSLRWQAAGVLAVSSVRTLVPAFHARGRTGLPVLASSANLLVFVTVALLGMGALGHVGIALATAAASTVQLGVLVVALRRLAGPLGAGELLGSLLRTGLASAGAAAVGWWVARGGSWSEGGSAANVVRLGLAGVAAAGAFLLAARVLGMRELTEVLAVVRRRRPEARTGESGEEGAGSR